MAINQCDGCRAGKPLVNGFHRMNESGYPDLMGCTAYLYDDSRSLKQERGGRIKNRSRTSKRIDIKMKFKRRIG